VFKYGSMLTYILSTALSLIVINQFEIQTNPSLVALISFLLCFLFFNLTNFNRFKIAHSVLFKSPIDFISINTITAIIWIGTFWGLKYISPGIFVSIFMGVIPLASIFITTNKAKFQYKEIILMLTLIFLTLGLASYESLKLVDFSKTVFYGLSLAVISGFFSAVYINYSQKLQMKFNFITLDFLCIRFYFVIATCFCFLFISGDHITTESILNKWYDFIFVSILTTIIPLYSLQKAILTLGGMQVSCLITFTPLVAYLLQILTGFQFNIIIFGIILIMSLLLIQYYRNIFYQKTRLG